jgi:hypothetical protein
MEHQRDGLPPRDAGFLAVASTDPASFIASLLLFGTAAIVLAIFVHSQVTGFQPKESWTEVSIGVSLIAFVLLGFMRYRLRVINQTLSFGVRQAARVDRFLAIGIWAIVRLQYEWNGVPTESTVWFANSKRSRRLGRVSEVTLAIDPAGSGRFVIVDLFS